MATVTDVLGADGALVTLGAPARAPAFVAASDATARASHELEIVMAEGPVTDAARGAPVAVAGPDLLDRWPRYGPEAAELGIHAVSAAPLGLRVRLGALCTLGRAADPSHDAAGIGLMADALTRILLGSTDIAGPDHELAAATLLGEAHAQAIVHQAAGIISVQCCCSVDDAADLLAARAFADGLSQAEIANMVVQGQRLFPVG